MDGIANVAKQQQTQINTEVTTSTVTETQKTQPDPKNTMGAESINQTDNTQQINSQKDVEDLVEQLNKAISPMTTSIKFGVDNDDIFYVSVIEQNTHKMIRRFPAEKAASFLPKMQEVTGILFDSKG